MAVNKKSKRGGKRTGAGRKPLPKEQKTVALTTYHEYPVVNVLGKEGSKAFIIEALRKNAKKVSGKK